MPLGYSANDVSGGRTGYFNVGDRIRPADKKSRLIYPDRINCPVRLDDLKNVKTRSHYRLGIAHSRVGTLFAHVPGMTTRIKNVVSQVLIHLLPTMYVLLLLAVTGCQHIRPGNMQAVQPMSSEHRVGNVYLVRGWIGVFSFGMDELSDKLKAEGIHASVYQDAQTSELANRLIEVYSNEKEHEPIILIGHSYGANDVVYIARKLNEHNIPVDLLITLDPVTPRKVPSNVALTINYYKPNGVADAMPWLRGIPLVAEEPDQVALMNVDLEAKRPDLMESNTNHFNIDKNKKVHADAMAHINEVCIPRPQWIAQRTDAPELAFEPVTATPIQQAGTTAGVTGDSAIPN